MRMINFYQLGQALSVLAFVAMSGCAMHYSGLPDEPVSAPVFNSNQQIFYKVYDRPVVSSDGPETVLSVLKAHSFFKDATRIHDLTIPQQGLFVEVNPKYKAPSAMALVFGYLSLSTMTLLPAWSNEDGFDVVFTVYRDGKLIKSYQYETRRFMAMWAGLLPFVWVNLMTADEDEVFQAFTEQFLIEAQPILNP